jgi:hypothetical protein
LTGGQTSRGSPRLDDEQDEEEDFADERAYIEEIHRQIAKDESANPDKAQLEKILRLKQRFRVNKKKPTPKQMDQLLQDIQGNILHFTDTVKRRIKIHVRKSTVALLTGYVYFRDVTNNLIRERV